MKPNYKRIFNDILALKYPEKQLICLPILNKNELSFSDIVNLNNLIFNDQSIETKKLNAHYKVYDKQTILKILKYQKDNQLNNKETATHFNLSRNTIYGWKKKINEMNKLELV